MNKFILNKEIVLICIIMGTFIFFVNDLYAVSDSPGLDVELRVSGCNNNTICEYSAGEDFGSCPNDCPLPESEEPNQDTHTANVSGGYRLVITDVVSSIDPGSAVISWETNKPTRSIFYWGKTVNYEIGSLSETTFIKKHDIRISNLDPSTKYFYSIVSKDKNDLEVSFSGEFFSQRLPNYLFPENIYNLKLTRVDNRNIFTWTNPGKEDFSSVRIIRTENSFASGPTSGHVVYEGGRNSFNDSGFDTQKYYYYSFFVRDVFGNYSSGIFLRVGPNDLQGKNILDSSIGTEIDKIVENGLELKLSNFNFQQNNIGISFVENIIPIRAGLSTEISIPSSFLPKNSSMFLDIDFQYGSIKKLNVLFRLNEDGTYYIGHMPPIRYEGENSFNINVLDRNLAPIDLIKGKFVISGTEKPFEKTKKDIFMLIITIFILFLCLFYVLFRKRFHRKERVFF